MNHEEEQEIYQVEEELGSFEGYTQKPETVSGSVSGDSSDGKVYKKSMMYL